MNDIRKEKYLNKYHSLQELMDAYMHNKTDLNLQEYYELVNYFLVKEKLIIDNSINETLERIFNDDDCVLGVHRTGSHVAYTNYMLINGIHLSNHSGRGVANTESNFDLRNNITFHNNYMEFLNALSEGSTYKRNGYKFGTAVIIKIPKSLINNEKALVINDGTTIILKPEYIYGYVSSHIDENGKIIFDEIVPSESVLKSFDGKLARYNKLMAIVNSSEYKSYMENIQNGEAILWIPEFDNVKRELDELNRDFEFVYSKEPPSVTSKK